jgi:amidohydrolase
MFDPDTVTGFYHDLHAMPETGWQEFRTAAYLAGNLREAGFEVTTGLAGTGVVGVLRAAAPGPVLALRADMDALPFVVDGQPCAIHACGHDAHCAMVLATALEVTRRPFSRGALKILFQPSEERDDGALKMVEAGVIDDVDWLFGMHLRPIQELRDGQATPALLNGSNYLVQAEIRGRVAHAGRPHLGINSIDAAVLAAHAIQGIRMDPGIPTSAKVTRIHSGGNALNTIPDFTEMAVDLRSQTNGEMARLIERTIQAITQACAAIQAEAKVQVGGGVPAAEVSEPAVACARRAITQVLGEAGLADPLASPGGDDFHYYLKHKPALKATYIGLGCDLVPGLHHPDLHFRLEALPRGTRIYLNLVEQILG